MVDTRTCDRCQCSSLDLDCPVEAFNQLYVNPSAILRGGVDTVSVKPGETKAVKVARSQDEVTVELDAPKAVDLCPDCYRAEFGEGILGRLRRLLG